MNRAHMPLVILAACLGLFSGCISLNLSKPSELKQVIIEKSDRWYETNRIAVIDVSGIIGVELPSLLDASGTSIADVKQKLLLAEKDRRVKAVILRINSPGGEAGASDIIHQEVIRFRARTGKPVVVSMLDYAASGGYYIACAGDQIVATPLTVTGSVGVIMQFMSAEGLFDKIGLRPETIKSGEMKDAGSFTHDMTPAQREVLQKINASLFARFVSVVRASRTKMTDEQIKSISDGRIVTAQEALELHMIDAIGYPDDAVDLAKQLAGIERADLVMYKPYVEYNSNIYAHGSIGQLTASLNRLFPRTSPAFLYLWSPGI